VHPAAGLVLAYLAIAMLPLAIAALPPRPPGRAFGIELAVALGFVGWAQVGLQFGLIARFQRISRPFGIDLVMQLHRQLGFVAVGFVLAHALLLPLLRPAVLALLDPRRGGWGLLLGALSTFALLLLIALSLGRRRLRLAYEVWRFVHVLLGAGALVAALAHVSLSGAYAQTPWKRAALALQAAAALGLVAHLRLVRPALLRRRPFEVVEVREEAPSTWVVTVAPVGHEGLRFAPGQFAWVRFGPSPWTLVEHPFSFSSSAESPRRIEFAIKELGDFTNAIGRLPPGTRAWLDGPHGSFSSDFEPAAGGLLLVAGGIGITPALSMLRTFADRGDRRPHVLVYATSRWERTAFRGALAALSRALDLRVVHVLESPPEGWTGEAGHVTTGLLARVLAGDPVVRHAFVCGPDAMMASVERSLRALGFPRERLHLERFQMV
jgi:predicted ferric reductase